MILASSLLWSSRSSGVSSVGGQEDSGITAVGNLTLAIMGDHDHNLSPIDINDGLNCGGQFPVGGREEMVSRIDNGELGARCLVLRRSEIPQLTVGLTFDSKTAPQV